MPSAPRPSRSAILRTLLCSAVLATLSSCVSLEIDRTSETSGTFESSARSFVILGWHLPRPAIQTAHENIADASLPHVVHTDVRRTNWGKFNWILEIISTRKGVVSGIWGHTGAELPEGDR